MAWGPHGVRLARARLAVGQDRAVVAVHDRADHVGGADLKDLLLAAIGQHLVELEVPGLLLVVHLTQGCLQT